LQPSSNSSLQPSLNSLREKDLTDIVKSELSDIDTFALHIQYIIKEKKKNKNLANNNNNKIVDKVLKDRPIKFGKGLTEPGGAGDKIEEAWDEYMG
jgi:hypothetical protein